MLRKAVKRREEIEYLQFDGANGKEICEFVGKKNLAGCSTKANGDIDDIYITTRHGMLNVAKDDVVVKDIKGNITTIKYYVLVGEYDLEEQPQTGAELIARERWEQIEKHGYSLANDDQYEYGVLVQAALYCLCPEMFSWPEYWDYEVGLHIKQKDILFHLVHAGAFIAAEIDREIRARVKMKMNLRQNKGNPRH